MAPIDSIDCRDLAIGLSLTGYGTVFVVVVVAVVVVMLVVVTVVVVVAVAVVVAVVVVMLVLCESVLECQRFSARDPTRPSAQKGRGRDP